MSESKIRGSKKISDADAFEIIIDNVTKAMGRQSPQVMMAVCAHLCGVTIMNVTTQHPDKQALARARMFNVHQLNRGIKASLSQLAHITGDEDPYKYEGVPEQQLAPSGLILPEKVILQ